MRRAESSSGDEVMKDAKRAEFCFAQAVDVFRTYSEKKNVTRLLKRVIAARRLQNKKRRMISFGALPPKAVSLSESSSSISDSSECAHDKTVVSDLTWMDNYSSEYYRKQHMLFLEQQEKKRPSLLSLFESNLCSYFCVGPPVSNVQFVEKRLDL